jgi:hypothetical protein
MMGKNVSATAVALATFGVSVSAWAADGGSGSSLDLAAPQQTAQAAQGYAVPTTATPAGPSDSEGYFGNWFARVDVAQASQPHWMTPLATVTPRLEEEYRYDQFYQHIGTGATIDNFGGGKGLELIPTETNEVILGVPPYEQRSNTKAAAQGLGDDPVLLIKQRLFSANEENGNYIVTAFLGFQAPTGIAAFTNDSWLITPTIAAGKGFGDFDVQGTFGVAFPTDHSNTIGDAINTNVALQYHFAQYFWPELEFNDTYWSGGERDGKNQLFLTPGIILGRFQLGWRFKLNVGVGYQFAVEPSPTIKEPLTPTLNHQWILTVRAAF